MLTVTAVALVAIALQLGGAAPPSAQAAQRASSSENQEAMGVPNAFAQRQRMIASLELIEQRLRAIESRFGANSPVDVRVVNADEIATVPADGSTRE
ncbi:MAG TPA: hypothetical protein DEB06_06945 [Phycisphaerales bacterium]|nr:hypothetical protein [Phycisphaerales bacterium]